jgi:predicted NBD/HSP70 family sugar kinase
MSSERARAGRWGNALSLLEELRRDPAATRASAARRIGLGTGSVTEVSARLRELRLLTERPAPPSGRGRPTAGLHPHPEGPVVLAIDLRHEDWRSAIAALDGRPSPSGGATHGSDPDEALAEIRQAVTQARAQYGRRLQAVSLAVAGTIRDRRIAQASSLGWAALDPRQILPDPDPGLPFLVDNDATLAGLAEARDGAGQGAGTLLHLTVEVGIGGALVIDGRPQSGAGGAAGEYGHMPFGDRTLRCPCGARGCWDLEVDGRALARHLGEPAPADPRSYALRVISMAREDPAAQRALDTVVAALAGGIAGLVNAHDPDVVTLGGLAGALRAAAPAAFESAFADGLMTFLRGQPPAVRTAAHGEDGALRGAVAAALDRVLSEAGLDAWAQAQRDDRPTARKG